MRVLICGDTVPTKLNQNLFQNGDAEALFGDILPVFHSADRVLINLECALTESDKAIPKFGPNLKGPMESAQTLRKAGVTDCGLSNNHTFDFGIEGFEDTIRAVETAGMNTTGHGATESDSRKPLVIPVGDKQLAVIAVCEHEYSYALENQTGARPFDPFETLTDVYDASQKYDYVIVTYHGGKEHCMYPSPRLMRACRAMVHMGADAVLCQHSHIIGCMEHYENGVILYGQGNFHFRYGDRGEGWDSGLIAQFDFGGHGFHLSLIPVVGDGPAMRLADDNEAREILQAMEQRNLRLADGTWIEGWRAFCASVQPMYEQTVYTCTDDPDQPRKKEHFAHYLDCEAHTDVYRELFKTWHAKAINE